MDKDQGLQRLREQIDERVREEKQEERDRLREARAAKTKFAAAKKIQAAWVQEHVSKASGAASIIWSWYEWFIASEEFREFSNVFRRRSTKVKISRSLTCSIPNPLPGCLDLVRQERQALSIDAAGVLYVHNLGKYGKSFSLDGEADLLKYIAWPILIEIADTITRETIWEIIGI